MTTAAAPVPAAAGHHHAVHTRTQVLGLLLMAGAVLLVLVGSVVAGGFSGESAFLLAPIVATSLGAFLSWRFGTWAKPVAIVLGLGGGMMTFWLVFGLFQPASFVEFSAGVAFTFGVLMMLGGGVAAIVRRKDQRLEATRAERIVERAALAAVALAIVVSLPMWLMARNSVDAAAAAGLAEVGIENFEFGGATTVTAEGGEVTMVVRNGDVAFHTFTIDGVVNVDLVPGSSEIVTFAAEPGTELTYYCVPHSMAADGIDTEDDMAGTLSVQ